MEREREHWIHHVWIVNCPCFKKIESIFVEIMNFPCSAQFSKLTLVRMGIVPGNWCTNKTILFEEHNGEYIKSEQRALFALHLMFHEIAQMRIKHDWNAISKYILFNAHENLH